MNETAPHRTRVRRLFIDQIEEGVARVLDGEEVLSLPVGILPAGAGEGDWIELGVKIIPPPLTDTEQRRKHLAADDPGGDIKL